MKIKNVLLSFVFLCTFILSGNAIDLKKQILEYNPEMLKELKATFIEIYTKNVKNGTKDYTVNWNQTDTFSIYNDMISTWPIVPSDQYSALILSSNSPMDFYICADANCNVKIAKYNTAPLNCAGGRYIPPLPWIIDNEDNLGFFNQETVGSECYTYSLTFYDSKDLYYSNTGIVVDGREMSVINSGDYYFAIYWSGQDTLVDNKMFTVTNSVSVKESLNNEVKVSYYSGDIVIENQIAQKAEIKVFDMTGRQVDFAKLNGKGQVSFDMSSKAKGVYIVNIKGNNFNISRKVAIM